MRLKRLTILLIAVLLCLVFAGCASKGLNDKSQPEPRNPTGAGGTENSADRTDLLDNESGQAEQDASEENKKEYGVDYEKVKPNENGQIMVLMYHGIGNEEKEWVRTVENFKKDLQVLYEKGYRVISLKDYVENNITVEAGFTPVVLTFDDGLQNQFNYIEKDGTLELDPDCAVGILEDFAKNHPDFGKAASFYVFYPLPFRQKQLIKDKFEFLVRNGYEIGNHGYNHENLRKISTDEVQKALTKNVVSTQSYLEGYEVFSLALPYGASPKGDDYKYTYSGSFEGRSYSHKAVLHVGYNPAPAPSHKSFDPLRLPRVRASEMLTAGVGMYDWLKYFEKNPEKRYISDGNPNTIAIPEAEEANLNTERINGKQLIKY